ncbi:MAG: 7TM diverse intracellular signaling domain-containing protein [Bacteroidota bacterium]|nr:7TM diverse intracellular signaling domain-containing protein [Bacteroidota bacterium]
MYVQKEFSFFILFVLSSFSIFCNCFQVFAIQKGKFTESTLLENDTLRYFKYRIENINHVSDSLFIKTPSTQLTQSSKEIGYLMPGDSAWYYFEFYNPTGKFFALTLPTHLPEVTFYQVTKNGKLIYKESSGINFKSNQQFYHLISGLFPINNVHDTLHIFVKAKSIRFGTGVGIDIKPLSTLINADLANRDKLSYLSGILLFAILISLLLFISLKEPFYLFFTLFATTYLAFLHLGSGNIRNIIPFNNYVMGYEYYAFPYVFMIVFITLYAASYIKIIRYKYHYRLLILVFILRALLFVYSVYKHEPALFHPIYDDFALVIVYLACFKNVKSDPSTWIVIAGLSLMIVTFFVHTSTYLGFRLTGPIFQIINLENLGFGVCAIYGLSIVVKFQQARIEKEKALKSLLDFEKKSNQELENKVIERTKTIQQQADEIEKQAREISRMNEILSHDNTKLKVDIKEVKMAHLMHKNASYQEFERMYPDNEACLNYIYSLKEEKGIVFKCSKCGNNVGTFNSIKFNTRCTKCGYAEPVTYNTIYYNVKFPLNKAFYLTYLVSTNQVYSLEMLSQMLKLRKQTCFAYLNKLKGIKSKNIRVKPGDEGWFNLIFTD